MLPALDGMMAMNITADLTEICTSIPESGNAMTELMQGSAIA